jgi:hypothetical protein
MALPSNLQRFIDEQADRASTRYDDLRAVVFNVSAQVLYALQHIGLTIPPQSDTDWTGEAGPGPPYLDAVGGGEHNAWATRNTVFLAWNVLHLARMITDAHGIPAYGNSTRDWNLGDPDHPNPEHRQ